MPNGFVTFQDAFVSVNGVDLSDHVKSVSLPQEIAMLDTTAMGNTTNINKGGLLNWTCQIEFIQDFAAAKVDATIFALYTAGTTFTLIVRPDNSDGVGATNPNYTGTGIISSYTPIGGSVGDLLMAPVTINSAGAMSRATA